MRPLRRRHRGTIQTDHENRIQTLERRIPVDYPLWGSTGFDQITINTIGNYPFGFGIFANDIADSPADGTDPDDWHTSGDEYVLLPQGFTGAFKIYMTVFLLGGNSLFGNYRTVTTPGDQDQNGKSWPQVDIEVWRDNAPFGSSTYRTFVSGGEHPPVRRNYQRQWWLFELVGGPVIMDPARDRWVVKPYFQLNENLGGNALISGNIAIELQPPGQFLHGIGSLGV